MKTIAFFNNKGGVGKTTLVYHLAYMLAEQGYKVLAADLDPQSNLTAMFLEDKLEELWMNNDTDRTILSAVKPLMKWKAHLEKNPEPSLSLPAGHMRPMGYVVLQHNVRSPRPGLDRPVKAYLKWAKRLPKVYRKYVLGEAAATEGIEVENDPYQLGFLKHYQSLMLMAMEVRKPIFRLKPADGAIGAHAQAVKDCYRDFQELAEKIAEVAEVTKSGNLSPDEPVQTTLFEL